MLGAPCYLGHIKYEIGIQKRISNLQFFKDDPDILDIFEARGLEYYSETHLSPYELAKLTIKLSMDESGIDPHSIDAVVIATDSLWDQAVYSRSHINQLLNELNLINAYPVGISLKECTGSSIALQVASNLVCSGQACHVLVVCTNKVKPGNDHERLIQPGISILSDAAAACLVSSKKNMDFRFLAVEQTHSSLLEKLNPEEDFENFIQGSLSGFQAAASKVFNRLSLTAQDFQWLISNNYLPHIIKMFANKIGFQEPQCFLDNIARFAHAHTADTLINLCDCLASGRLSQNDKLLLLSNSPTSWGAVSLECM